MTLQKVKSKLSKYNGKEIKIMEVCGTHTASIFSSGIRSLLSPKIKLISGPGCPVCVTSASYIDKLAQYSLMENHCVLTFGDMMKVRGSKNSLTEAKAMGGNVMVVYSPLAALDWVVQQKNTQFIFAAVGFETTAPIYALMVRQMIKRKISNLKLLTSIKTILPAMEYICENEEAIDAFLCPGHVSVITGSDIYEDLAIKYKKPFVVGGFEGEHIIAAVYDILKQLQKGEHKVKNMYAEVVSDKGNINALNLLNEYFENFDVYWRGIGKIKKSALRLKKEYAEFDAGSNFEENDEDMPKGCRCCDVILGRINPPECPMFNAGCTPLTAVGPCMVSAEGACGIWYKNR